MERMSKKESRAGGSDERFQIVASDPKFHKIPRREHKVGIDERFKGMLEGDSGFSLSYEVDKRGRPLGKTATRDLRKYYRLEEEEGTHSKNREPSDDSSADGRGESDEDGEIKLDLARGEGNLQSSSGEEDSSDVSDPDEDGDGGEEHKWGEMDVDAPRVEEATSRLAVCNMDWDRIRARDLLILFHSFKPSGGVVSSVRIYPSEFGRERMAEEEREGPRLLKTGDGEQSGDSSGDEDLPEAQCTAEELKRKKIQLERLRMYQMERLRYFYAVVECDSPDTANAIYDACNNMEYETSATRLDLRFIPSDMTFDECEVKEEAREVGDLEGYEPRKFDTPALKMASALTLTWDETDPERLKLAEKTFNPESLDKLDLKNFVGSGSEESSDEGEGRSERYKSLLADAISPPDSDPSTKSVFGRKNFMEEEEEEKGLEVQWTAPLKEEEEEGRMKKSKDPTPFQKYLDKRKEKKRERKAEVRRRKEESRRTEEEGEESSSDSELDQARTVDDSSLDLLLSEDRIENPESERKKHFNLKKLVEKEKEKKKKKPKKRTDGKKGAGEEEREEDFFEMNLEDKRFSALYSNHLFNIDPTDPNFKRTGGMELIKTEKLRRAKRKTRNPEEVESSVRVEDSIPNEIPHSRDSMQLAEALKMKAQKWKKRNVNHKKS